MKSARESQNRSVCIIGMGYVGSSLAAVLASEGFAVHGIDIDPDRVSNIESGICPIEEEGITNRFEEAVEDGLITATTSYREITNAQTILVTVGTPLSSSDPDLSAVTSAVESIGEHLTPDTLVIFRSTLPAGLTEGHIRDTLDETSGLTAGKDYALAFCPERMAEGSAYKDLTTLPVVVGGLTESCGERAEAFWEDIGEETISVSSPTTAELTKLADNWWIDLNIAMANEVALLAEQVGVDAMEVIRAANTLPKGDHHVNILYPGAGVGGSCLVKDPWFVASLGEQHDLDLETPRVSRRVNDQMPGHVVDLVTEHILDMDDPTIAVLGYAFKAGTDDTRNTPAKEVLSDLQTIADDVRVTDPYVDAKTVEEETGLSPLRLPEALTGVDVVLVVTGHEPYRSLDANDLDSYVGDKEYTIIDGRFAFNPDDFTESRGTYRGVGRGGR